MTDDHNDHPQADALASGLDIRPGFAQALDIFATVLTDGTETGRREARAMLLDLGRQLDTWARNGALIRAKPGGKLEAVTDCLPDVLDGAAILWDIAEHWRGRAAPEDHASPILGEIMRRHGSAAAREFVSGLALPFVAAWRAIPDADREPFDLEAGRWLAANLEDHATRAGLIAPRNP